MRTPTPPARRAIATILSSIALAALVGCGGDASQPNQDTPSEALFDASLDPSRSTFVLQRVPDPDGTSDAFLELVGSNLTSDPSTETVTIDVALRNSSREPLSGPAQVWLTRFSPAGTAPSNADLQEPDGASFGFDYTTLLGDDQALSPNETSRARTWSFHVPAAAPFSFAASAVFGQSLAAYIEGEVWSDLDDDGSRDAGEPPFGGSITTTAPDGTVSHQRVRANGSYRVPVRTIGLHTVTYQPPEVDCLCDVRVTTPNPLQVVITADGSGSPQSYLHADFGARVTPWAQPAGIVLTDLPPDQIQQDPFRFQDIALHDDLLVMTVGFGGCAIDHEFVLYMSGGFRESNPVQARLVLGHDAHDEKCDAWFVRTLSFDLAPLRHAFEAQYGRAGMVVLRIVDPAGQEHSLRYSWHHPAEANLIQNGSFERGGQPTLEGWQVQNEALTQLVAGGAPEAGRWSLRLEADWAPTTGVVRALLPGVRNGDVLRVSAWIRAESGGGGVIYLESQSWQSQPTFSDSQEWTQVAFTSAVSVASGDSLWLVVSSLPTEVQPRVGYFDRVRVERGR